MTEIFGTKLVLAMVAIAALYWLLALVPFWFPGIVVYRRRKTFPRPWLFVGVVSCIVYGLVTLLLFVVVPAEAYAIFIAPQLQAAGKPFGMPIVEAIKFIEDYGWLILPFGQIIITVVTTRKLFGKWERICAALFS